MRSAFKIPRFSKAELHKIQIKLEMEFKVSAGVLRRRNPLIVVLTYCTVLYTPPPLPASLPVNGQSLYLPLNKSEITQHNSE